MVVVVGAPDPEEEVLVVPPPLPLEPPLVPLDPPLVPLDPPLLTPVVVDADDFCGLWFRPNPKI